MIPPSPSLLRPFESEGIDQGGLGRMSGAGMGLPAFCELGVHAYVQESHVAPVVVHRAPEESP